MGKRNTYGSFLCRAPDERKDDETFVPSLVSVHCIHLDTGERRGLQQSRDTLQLLSVRSDNAYITRFAPCLNEEE